MSSLREEVMAKLEAGNGPDHGNPAPGEEPFGAAGGKNVSLDTPPPGFQKIGETPPKPDEGKKDEKPPEPPKPESEKKPAGPQDFSKMSDDDWLKSMNVTDPKAIEDFKARTMMRVDYTQKRMKESEELKQVDALKAEIQTLRSSRTRPDPDNLETIPDLNDPVVKQIRDLEARITAIQESEGKKTFAAESTQALKLLDDRGLKNPGVSDELYLGHLAVIGEKNPNLSIMDAAKLYVADHIDEVADKVLEARAKIKTDEEVAGASETPRDTSANMHVVPEPAEAPKDAESMKNFVLKRNEELKAKQQ